MTCIHTQTYTQHKQHKRCSKVAANASTQHDVSHGLRKQQLPLLWAWDGVQCAGKSGLKVHADIDTAGVQHAMESYPVWYGMVRYGTIEYGSRATTGHASTNISHADHSAERS